MTSGLHRSKDYTAVLLPVKVESAITALVAGAATIELTVPDNRPHCFAAVEFYSDSAGTPSVPTAGTATFTIKTPLIPSAYVAITGGVLNFTSANTLVSWAANTNTVKVVLASISGGSTTHVRLRVMENAT